MSRKIITLILLFTAASFCGRDDRGLPNKSHAATRIFRHMAGSAACRMFDYCATSGMILGGQNAEIFVLTPQVMLNKIAFQNAWFNFIARTKEQRIRWLSNEVTFLLLTTPSGDHVSEVSLKNLNAIYIKFKELQKPGIQEMSEIHFRYPVLDDEKSFKDRLAKYGINEKNFNTNFLRIANILPLDFKYIWDMAAYEVKVQSLVQNREFIVQLGETGYRDGVYGNKARSFYVFKSLGLNYPEGIVIESRVVETLLDDKNLKNNAEILAKLVLKEIGLNESQRPLSDSEGRGAGVFDKLSNSKAVVSLMVRSSPQVSMPGRLETLVDVLPDTQIDDIGYGLAAALIKVARSWNLSRAQEYRIQQSTPDDFNMGIIVQIKAKADMNEKSASGVAYSRNPNSGQKAMFGNFAVKTMGEDIVSGKISGEPIENMGDVFPEIYRRELPAALEKLEEKCGYPQEVEFVIEDGKLSFLQTRDVKFSLQGEIRYIQDAVKEGRLSQAQSIPKLKILQEAVAMRQVFKVKENLTKQVVARGETSIPGAMAGRLAFSIETANVYADSGSPVILLATPQTREEIIKHIAKFPQVGLITTYGGDSSHEAVLARAAGIPAILHINNGIDTVKKVLRYETGSELAEGDFIVIDGNRNEIFLTPEKDALVKDTLFFDVTYGIDIVAFKERFKRIYLDGKGMKRILDMKI